MTTTHEHVYMLWDCQQCGHARIPCSPDARYCPQCGDVRTFMEFDASYLPGNDATWEAHDHVAIPPAVVARLMKAGPSWFCTNCTADNYGDETLCHHCAAPRKASDDELRRVLDNRTFVAYMEGDQGATAALVEQFGEYAGMRAAQGLSFDQGDAHHDQLARAQQNRSAFKHEMAAETHHQARPKWDASDTPSAVESFERTHGDGEHSPYDEEDARYIYTDEEWKKKRSFKKKIAGAGIGALLLGGGSFTGIAVWGSQTSAELGRIEQLSWERHIHEERWTQVIATGWEAELREQSEVPPVNGRGERAGVSIISCAPAHHHYEDYVCGTMEVSCTHMESYSETYSCTRQESYSETYSCSRSESYQCGETCSTSRGSNGMATRSCSPRMCSRSVSDTCTRTAYRSVPDTCTRMLQRPIHSSDTVNKICQRSIEASSCSYHTQRWEPSDHHELNGTSKPATWPEGSLEALERERREATYHMTVLYDANPGEEPPYTERKVISHELFKRYTKGSPVTFFVNNFGGIGRWVVGDHTKDDEAP